MIITEEMKKLLEDFYANSNDIDVHSMFMAHLNQGNVPTPPGSAAYVAATQPTRNASSSSQEQQKTEDKDIRASIQPSKRPARTADQLEFDRLYAKLQHEKLLTSSIRELNDSKISKPTNFVATLDKNKNIVIDGGQVSTSSSSAPYRASKSTAPECTAPTNVAINLVTEAKKTGNVM